MTTAIGSRQSRPMRFARSCSSREAQRRGRRNRAAGGELKAFYLVTGQYDAVAISELPNDEAAARVALGTGSMGNVQTETLRAFSEDEYRKVIAALP